MPKNGDMISRLDSGGPLFTRPNTIPTQRTHALLLMAYVVVHVCWWPLLMGSVHAAETNEAVGSTTRAQAIFAPTVNVLSLVGGLPNGQRTRAGSSVMRRLEDPVTSKKAAESSPSQRLAIRRTMIPVGVKNETSRSLTIPVVLQSVNYPMIAVRRLGWLCYSTSG